MASINPPNNLAPITKKSWGTGNSKDLYEHMGFGASTYKGNQPSQAILGRFAPIMGSRVQSQLLHGNELEGKRQALIDNALRMMKPENQVANADRMRAKGVNSALSQAPQTDFAMRGLGLGQGARGGAVQAGINQANTQANDFLS